jgi:hypothetical protein
MPTWGAFRTQIRRSILADVSEKRARWSDEILMDCVNWAMDEFCAHTAVATAVQYAASGVGPYPVPENIYEKLEHAGMVYLTSEGASPTDYEYLNPIRYTEGLDLTADRGFYEWPEGSLYLAKAPSESGIVGIRYYAYYNTIVTDEDEMPVPRWALPAIGYLTAAYALSGDAIKSANIRQWAESPEKGTPEDNSLRRQQEWMLELYHRELSKFPRQDRENSFRIYGYG